MNRIVDTILRVPPHHHHAGLDVAMAGMAGLGLAMHGGLPGIVASCASAAYFFIMIGKEIARWVRQRRENNQSED